MKGATVFFLLCCMLLSACQPTPEAEIVTPKDFDLLLKKARSSPQTVQVTLVPDASPATVPEYLPDTDRDDRFHMEFFANTESFHVAVDARVVQPQGPFPILEVTPGDFDEQSAQPFFDVLTEGFTLYTGEELETKATLEHEIQLMQQFIDDGPPLPFEPWDGDLFTVGAEGNPGMVVGVEYPVPGRMVSYGTLLPDRPVDYSRQQDERTDTYSVYSFDKRLDMPGVERIAPEAYDQVHDGAAISARAAAKAALSPLEGLGDFSIADIRWSHDADDEAVAKGITGKQAYLVRLTPVFHGASLLYTGASAMDIPEGGYTPIWHYEHVLAAVDGDGTILGMAWESPLTETEVLADDTTLLPFEEIMGIFTQQVNRIYSYEEATDAALNVTDVQLGLFRIREQGDMESGLLVPAWFITGEYHSADHPEDVSLQDEYWPIAVINAINGSIIDVNNGY